MGEVPGIQSKQEREALEFDARSAQQKKFLNIAARGRKALKCEELSAYRKEYEMMEKALIDEMITCRIVDIKERLSFYDRTCGILYGLRKLLYDVDMDAAKKPLKDA